MPMTPYEPPQTQPLRRAGLGPLYAAFSICALMVVAGFGLLAWGFFKTLDTTPSMGILVDAQGNRLPVEGYPQLCLGIVISAIFSILAILSVIRLRQKRDDAVSS